MHVVREGTPGASVVGVRRVNELDFYNPGRDQPAEKVGLTGRKTTAMVRLLDLQEDPDCYKRTAIGKQKFDRYSQNATAKIQEALESNDIQDVWRHCRGR